MRPPLMRILPPHRPPATRDSAPGRLLQTHPRRLWGRVRRGKAFYLAAVSLVEDARTPCPRCVTATSGTFCYPAVDLLGMVAEVFLGDEEDIAPQTRRVPLSTGSGVRACQAPTSAQPSLRADADERVRKRERLRYRRLRRRLDPERMVGDRPQSSGMSLGDSPSACCRTICCRSLPR